MSHGENIEYIMLSVITVWSSLFRVEWIVPCLAFIVTAALYLKSKPKQSDVYTMTSCPNPDCVRCQRYREVQASARKRMPWVLQQVQSEFGATNSSLKRISNSIQNPHLYCSKGYQAPTVLMVQNLRSSEVVTDWHSSLGKYMHGQDPFLTSLFLLELSQVPLDLWKPNDTLQGSWEVLSFLNQGRWDDDLRSHCPQLDTLVRNMPNLLDSCLFGNVIVSKIYAGTFIEPHCGPSNVRHRMQYTLAIPRTPLNGNGSMILPSLRVGKGKPLTWNRVGDFFVFDDSIVHSVKYGNNKNAPPSPSRPFRIVLIVDLWHPDLSPAERALIRYMYPPFA